ncbi:MAG: ATP-binding protein [Gammaproteobacteria bacterium]|nr:ATP-binding protein [Gammaproteobacteria bacterium]
MYSIKNRLTLISMIVLTIFMILTAIALERAVVKRALQAEEDRLELLIYGLLAAVDRNRSGSSITISHERLFESSLMTEGSGLSAMLYNEQREIIWRSRSMVANFPDIETMEPGDWRFDIVDLNSSRYFRRAFAMQWPDVRDQLQHYDVVVWKNADRHFNDVDRFRQTLWSWLIITTILLLLVMYLVMMWSLRPLKQVGREVKAIEDRKQNEFESRYPREIKPLTENLNILLNREQLQRQRYRNAMDDLAHSLKTPLAVLKGFSTANALDQTEIKTLNEQVDRMNQIVSYQLQKATNVAGGEIVRPLDLVPLTTRLISALEKVYQARAIKVEVELPDRVMLRMDEGDCMEVIGNLFDNAFKYGKNRVRVEGRLQNQTELVLEIEDDGQGLEPGEIEKILKRGTRLDEASEGQGIGLAVVADIVMSYNIAMTFAESKLGGLAVKLVFQIA